MDIDLKFLLERFRVFKRYLIDRSIYTKLLLGYLTLTFGLAVLIVVTSYVFMRQSIVAQNKEGLLEKARIIAAIFTEEHKGAPEYVRMRNIENLTEAQVIYVGQDMVARRIPRVGGPDNHPIMDNIDPALQQSIINEALDVQLVTSILKGNDACDISKVDFIGGKVLFAGSPVYAPDGLIAGAAILYMPYVEVQGMATDMTLLIMMSCVLAAGLSAVFALVVSRWLVRPIETLTVIARRMSAGHYGEPVPLDQKDEIGELGGALGHLSFRLKNVISDLRDEKSKLEQILSGIGEGLVAVDQDGTVVHYNNAALELLELSDWNAENDPERGAYREKLLEMLRQATMSGERAEEVWKNASDRSIAARVWPMRNEENSLIGAVGLLRDVSEAERLEQMRKDYVANISHELRTPLTGIRGMVEPLLDGYMDTEEEKMDSYRIIYQETMRLEKLIGDMLDMSRLQAGRSPIELEPMRIEGVLEAALRRMQKRAQEGGVELCVSIREALPAVMGNEDRILQVLIILMDNALSFTPTGGKVTLSARRQGRSVYVSVADTGAGIDPSDLPYIWERFYKADKSRMRTTGTGLGLAIAKLVVECMGGLITVRSELGKGTEFEFSLAICEEQGA